MGLGGLIYKFLINFHVHKAQSIDSRLLITIAIGTIYCPRLKLHGEVSRFVSERISTFDGVLSTATHFILKKYKIEGVMTEREDEDRRIPIN